MFHKKHIQLTDLFQRLLLKQKQAGGLPLEASPPPPEKGVGGKMKFKGFCPRCGSDDVDHISSSSVKIDRCVRYVFIWQCSNCLDNAKKNFISPLKKASVFYVDEEGAMYSRDATFTAF